MTSDNSRHRLGLLAVAALSLFGALFARLWFLQVVEGSTAKAEAASNSTDIVITPAPRGRILDRNRLPLVENRESIVVGIDYQDYSELSKARQTSVLKRLSTTLSMGKAPENQISVSTIRKRLNDSRYTHLRPVPVADDISTQNEIYFSEQAARFPSVVVERTTVRSYPYGSLAAHVLGYVGPLSEGQWADLEKHNDKDKPYGQTDEIGKAGVEQEYESYLRGTPGRRVYEVDRTGKVVREIKSERVEPKAGDDVYLSLDARVQYKAEEALQAQLANQYRGREGKQAGGLVVMDPSTGQVRAMASYPTYNPADLVGGISCPTWRDLQGLDPNSGNCRGDFIKREIKRLKKEDDAPVPKLLNRAYQGAYQPASTFKLASSYAALKVGLRNPNSSTVDQGVIDLCGGKSTAAGCIKHNAGDKPHGTVNLSQALTVSSDIFFYEVGRDFWASRDRLGQTAFQDAVGDLGYGHQTGIDLPVETAGQMPTPKTEMELSMALFKQDPAYYENSIDVAKDYGRWNTGKSADMAIGQKLTATPLQTANAYAALQNGGTLYRPSVLEMITAAQQPGIVHKAYEKHVIHKVDFGAARDVLITGFKGVVNPNDVNPYGTATTPFAGFPFDQMPLAGKTGTAQTGDYKNGQHRPDNSVFVGFSVGGQTNWVATALLEYSGSGAEAAAPAIRMVLEPIADQSLYQFQVPRGGEIDAQKAADDAGITAGGSD